MQKSAEQSQNLSYMCVAEPQDTVKTSPKSVNVVSSTVLLPSYDDYIATKRQYQQGEISKEKVLKNLETVSEELKNFIKRLYRNTNMPEERNILSKTITEINVGNL